MKSEELSPVDAIKKRILEEEKLTGKQNAEISVMERVEEYLDFRYHIRYNEISMEFETYNKEESEWQKLNDAEIYRDLKKNHFKFSMSDLSALLRSDYTKKYNPFKDFFENLGPWGGRDYIAELTTYLDLGDQAQRFHNMLLKWMVRSIACSLGELFNKQAIVIIGGQNNGKSSLLRWLCPEELKPYYKEDMGTDKDSKIALASNFIINIDELSTMFKKDINSLKSLMSTDTIKERVPYDRTASRMKRRANFLASTDRGEFLSDEAGSVRWICFRIQKIDWEYSNKLLPEQLWTQAYNYYRLYQKHEYNPQLTREELEENENYNLQFYQKGAEMEAILHLFDRGTIDDHDLHLTSTQALGIIKNYEEGSMFSNKITAVSLGKAFKLLGFENTPKYEADLRYSIKGYYVKINDEFIRTKWEKIYGKKEQNPAENEKSEIPF